MSNKNYQKGYRFEKRVANFFRNIGYYAIESRGSKGLYDVIAIPSEAISDYKYPEVPLMIQCKNKKYVEPSVYKNIIHHHKWKGIPLMASNRDRKIYLENMDRIEFDFV